MTGDESSLGFSPLAPDDRHMATAWPSAHDRRGVPEEGRGEGHHLLLLLLHDAALHDSHCLGRRRRDQ